MRFAFPTEFARSYCRGEVSCAIGRNAIAAQGFPYVAKGRKPSLSRVFLEYGFVFYDLARIKQFTGQKGSSLRCGKHDSVSYQAIFDDSHLESGSKNQAGYPICRNIDLSPFSERQDSV